MQDPVSRRTSSWSRWARGRSIRILALAMFLPFAGSCYASGKVGEAINSTAERVMKDYVRPGSTMNPDVSPSMCPLLNDTDLPVEITPPWGWFTNGFLFEKDHVTDGKQYIRYEMSTGLTTSVVLFMTVDIKTRVCGAGVARSGL